MCTLHISNLLYSVLRPSSQGYFHFPSLLIFDMISVVELSMMYQMKSLYLARPTGMWGVKGDMPSCSASPLPCPSSAFSWSILSKLLPVLLRTHPPNIPSRTLAYRHGLHPSSARRLWSLCFPPIAMSRKQIAQLHRYVVTVHYVA